MKKLTALLTIGVLAVSPAVASANLNAVNESTDEAGHVWKLTVGSLSGGEVKEEVPGGAHFAVSIISKGLGVGGGHVYVSTFLGVREYTPSGALIRTFDEGGMQPDGVAVTPTSVFVSEVNHISQFTPEGFAVGGFGNTTTYCNPFRPYECSTTSEVEGPTGVAIDAEGDVEVATVNGFQKWHNEWKKVTP